MRRRGRRELRRRRPELGEGQTGSALFTIIIIIMIDIISVDPICSQPRNVALLIIIMIISLSIYIYIERERERDIIVIITMIVI